MRGFLRGFRIDVHRHTVQRLVVQQETRQGKDFLVVEDAGGGDGCRWVTSDPLIDIVEDVGHAANTGVVKKFFQTFRTGW